MTAGTAGTKPARGLGASTQAFVVLVTALAVLLVAAGWLKAGGPYDWGALAVLTVLGVASWLVRDSDAGQRVQLSLTSIILLASAVIVGPVGAAIVGAASTALEPRRSPFVVRLFNVSLG